MTEVVIRSKTEAPGTAITLKYITDSTNASQAATDSIIREGKVDRSEQPNNLSLGPDSPSRTAGKHLPLRPVLLRRVTLGPRVILSQAFDSISLDTETCILPINSVLGSTGIRR